MTFLVLETGWLDKHHLGVSKSTGTPKWMAKIMEKPIKMDDLGVPLFWGNIHFH